MSKNIVQAGRTSHASKLDALPASLQSPRWYAVQCLSHREVGASAHLCNQDYEIFLPRRKKIRRHARKIDTVLAPLFPGYLFVNLDLSRDRWRSINGTHGVVGLVMQGDAPVPAPVGIIETIQNACDDNGVLCLQSDGLRLGDKVRILTGAFADMVGEIERLGDAGRIRVLLNILGACVPVQISKDGVVRASSVF